MPRRAVLTNRQREQFFALPTDRLSLTQHYVLSMEDIGHIRQRRRSRNRLGFAVQLCALRYPGRLLQPGECIPDQTLAFIASQLELTPADLLDYAERHQTRYEHSIEIQKLYGFRPFSEVADAMEEWLRVAAEHARTNDALAHSLMEELRRRRIIVPAPTTLERICADALVYSENAIAQRIADRLDEEVRQRLLALLEERVSPTMTRFVSLRHHEPGNNSRFANSLLDRLEVLQSVNVHSGILKDVPLHRVARLRRQGERYFADGMRDLPYHRRLAILAVCIIEWRKSVIDALIETHDRIVGRLYRASERKRDELVSEKKAIIQSTLRQFSKVGTAIVDAKDAGKSVQQAIGRIFGWEAFRELVHEASRLESSISLDPLDFVDSGFNRFRRYAPRFLRLLHIQGAQSAAPLIRAIECLRTLNDAGNRTLPGSPPIGFARPKWKKRLRKNISRRTWETAVLFSIRDGFRSGDIWEPNSSRHAEPSRDLVPMNAVVGSSSLAVPSDPDIWLEDRRAVIDSAFDATRRAADRGELPESIVKNAQLCVSQLEGSAPAHADDLILELYRNIPDIPITDLLLEVDADVAFTESFTDLRTGVACRDRIGLLTVLLSDGVNLGLRQMGKASTTHSYWELMRIARWHVQDDAYNRALATVVEAQAQLPMAQFWGAGLTASSDGQYIRAGGPGEAMNLVNRKYGAEPGLKAYTHVSDQYAPFATKAIPATAFEAPFILDGLVSNDAGRRVREHYADTGGFTDHVFAMCSILGYRFAPRIRDLPAKRLYAFAPDQVHRTLRPLIAAKVNENLIRRNWMDVLRLSASTAAGVVRPSTALRKLASYPRQNELALALREIGRVERSIFLLRWILDADLQRRAQLGLNKGEAHHALKRAISFHRRGEISDRSSEGQHYRVAGMNLIAAIIIYWNTKKLGDAVQQMTNAGSAPDPTLLPHVSPLGWEHINLTGEYRWPIQEKAKRP